MIVGTGGKPGTYNGNGGDAGMPGGGHGTKGQYAGGGGVLAFFCDCVPVFALTVPVSSMSVDLCCCCCAWV